VLSITYFIFWRSLTLPHWNKDEGQDVHVEVPLAFM
jgi:hypothetical protein